jgi:hypothetical protein
MSSVAMDFGLGASRRHGMTLNYCCRLARLLLRAGEKNQRPNKNPGIAAGVLHSLNIA